MEEEALLPKSHEDKNVCISYEECVDELKKVSYIAAPMVVVTLSQYLLRIVPMMMVGHLGELALSSTAIATSITNVTGYSVLFGMAGALETLCGQAYGAKQYKKLGIYTYGANLSLFLVCLPIAVLWNFMDQLLIFLGQDPSISNAAGKYSIWLIPSLFPYAILESMVPFLQTQSLILPMLYCSFVTLCINVPLCWFLIFKIELGTKGAALGISLSYWVNVILLGLYLKFSPACAKSRTSFSKDVFKSIGEFLRLAFASAGMVCLEWWSFEVVVLLSGILPNPKLQSSVLSICFNIVSIHYLIPYSIGAAASTRISNELGAGNSSAARLVVYTVMTIATAEAITVGIIIFRYRSIVGFAFTNENEVIDYLREITPVICSSIIMDSLQAVLSGIARGSGWQHIGSYINFGAFYLVGIPLAVVLGFVQKLKGMGLWSGLVLGSMLQVIIYSFVTCFTSWEKQANKARERIFKGRITNDDELVI